MRARTRLILNTLAMTVIGGAGSTLKAMTPHKPVTTAASFLANYCCNGPTCNCCGNSGALCNANGCACK